ncbi:hypothetical protein DRP53_10295 [candidate division WOR-3 bacterium]|uniref:Uncharacterized protein n=1 Tax=candidate division WOR-3 bacterium TaxID=2052148 RepID=A0A660SCY8_UNCW3|nr:MAG: hypothetical protein DRP53_10295 [candidate division WOR-3 bacterium]
MAGHFKINSRVRAISFFLFILALIVIHCHEPQPTYDGEVEDIAFGESWNSTAQDIGDTTYQFDSGTKIVYYSFTLTEGFECHTLIKKTWEYEGSDLFSATTYMPIGTNRISGEFHYYDNTSLPDGTYKLKKIQAWHIVAGGKGEWKDIKIRIPEHQSFTIGGQKGRASLGKGGGR